MIGSKNTLPIIVFPSKKPGATKHQIVVSKKVSKKAVERNLIKRRIKSILHATPIQTPLVVVCRPSALAYDFNELKVAVLHQLPFLTHES